MSGISHLTRPNIISKQAMVEYTTTILQFAEQGEKTGWTYIEIPADIAQQLLPGNKKSFRVKGSLDEYQFQGTSLLPMGGGKFILPLNASVRKKIHKRKGAMLRVKLLVDPKPLTTPDWMIECLADEPTALSYFNGLPKSHQNYFIKWIESAKTEPTRTRRLAQAVTAFTRKFNFGEMMRMNKE